MRDHTRLRAFELADRVVVAVYGLTAKFPREETYGLVSQIRRAAVSVPSNIVEGCTRDSQADYLRFLHIAYGSLKELHYQLDLSIRLGFITKDDFLPMKPMLIETEKVLNGLLRSIRAEIRR
jgi:four helix bundle protein